MAEDGGFDLFAPLRRVKEWIDTALLEPADLEDMLGLERHEINEPSEKCKPVLEIGLTPSVCKDFRAIRRWVACRAWQLLESDKYDRWRDAIRQAWMEARTECLKHGVAV